ncbi:energy-coupling factor transport system substrate-specific component [Motilibacter peucedani]|uniref:Energy-coupling factor transport system substrate-specific component n=1 Tax=Motilibacter peucedani TaxID=598650 RepID=A0A420XMI7_9ACTN|nr:ECF transporter S component [Motilibacter peucedani]RKS72474.1 energy-coupling factor transport system substrate-specific component [Motilibacter peucedani]
MSTTHPSGPSRPSGAAARAGTVIVAVGAVAAVLGYLGTEATDLPRAASVIDAVVALVAAGLVCFGVLTRPRAPWRTVDIVTAAVLAVASGVVFWAWTQLWNAVSPAFSGFPPGQAVMYGMWFLPGALVPLVVRKPGAAVFAELVASTLEYLLASSFGAPVIVYGLVQGLCAEAVWAAFRYRRWGLVPSALAGAAAGLGAALLDLVYYYADWSGPWKLTYVVAVVVSGAVLTGGLSWWLLRALVPTGALGAFAAGRSRELV